MNTIDMISKVILDNPIYTGLAALTIIAGIANHFKLFELLITLSKNITGKQKLIISVNDKNISLTQDKILTQQEINTPAYYLVESVIHISDSDDCISYIKFKEKIILNDIVSAQQDIRFRLLVSEFAKNLKETESANKIMILDFTNTVRINSTGITELSSFAYSVAEKNGFELEIIYSRTINSDMKDKIAIMKKAIDDYILQLSKIKSSTKIDVYVTFHQNDSPGLDTLKGKLNHEIGKHN